MYDVIIIGAGVIGSSIARELSRYKLEILVIEKEKDVCEVTSMANSGIIHSGYDPKEGTLKAKLNLIGNQNIVRLREELGFEYKNIGSLTVAFEENDLETLKQLQQRGFNNNVNTKILNHDEVLALEPNLNKNVKYALLAETCGIVNPFEYTVALMENAMDNGVKLHLEEEVVNILNNKNHYVVLTNKGKYEARIVVNAAGLMSGKIAKMIGTDIEIKPRKGEYLVINHLPKAYINHTIFPLPTEKGKGVLMTPTTSFNYLVGPTSEFVPEDDDFATDTSTLDSIKEKVSKMLDNIPFNETIRSFAGLRAVGPTGDFIIEEDKNNKNFYHLAGIDSPGLASSYGIAAYLVDLIKENNNLTLNPNFNPYRRPFVHLNSLSIDDKNNYFKKDPKYGHIICRCEKVSEAEIIDTIHRNCGARTVRGVKKRVRPGFGKCQGGFCESLVVNILARELKVDEKEICYGREHSEILKYDSKEDHNENI